MTKKSKKELNDSAELHFYNQFVELGRTVINSMMINLEQNLAEYKYFENAGLEEKLGVKLDSYEKYINKQIELIDEFQKSFEEKNTDYLQSIIGE